MLMNAVRSGLGGAPVMGTAGCERPAKPLLLSVRSGSKRNADHDQSYPVMDSSKRVRWLVWCLRMSLVLLGVAAVLVVSRPRSFTPWLVLLTTVGNVVVFHTLLKGTRAS